MAEIIKINDDTWRIEDGDVRFFLLCGTEKAALIDSGMTTADAAEIAGGLTDLPIIMVNTHADPDHIAGNAAFEEVYMSHEEEENYRNHNGKGRIVPIHEGRTIDLGERTLKVIDIPGHTPGSIALLDEKNRVLIAGDSVQDGSIFMFGPMRNMNTYIKSLRHLTEYDGQYDEIYAMHGTFPVKPELVYQLLEGAEKACRGEITGEPVNIFGNDVRLLKLPCAGFLCEPRETKIEYTARRKGTDDYAPIEDSGLSAEVVEEKPGFPKEMTVRITAKEDFSGVIRIGMSDGEGTDADARFYLPGFMYGTNRGEAPLVVDSKTPRLRMQEEMPAAPWWMVRSDRMSHPCAMKYLNGRLTGFAASPYYIKKDGDRTQWFPGQAGEFNQYAGFGCSLEQGQVWYTLGYENAPWMFFHSHSILPRKELGENCFEIKAGESVDVKLYCYDIPAEDERGIHDILKNVYEIFHESPRTASSVSKTVREISTAIAEYAWVPESHAYTCFVFDKRDHFENRLLPSISWTNGLSAGVPMLMSGYRLDNDKMKAQALELIDHIVKTSINAKNDLPFLAEHDGVWSNHGWWYDKQNTPGHVAYLVGQSVYLILKAYELEKRNGTVHDDWMAYAERVIARTEKSRNGDGEYPYVFSEKTGSGVEYDSFSGAWCMAAAAYYSYLTGKRDYLPGILESEKWYHDEYIKHQECYAGPLDIDKNMDSEGILSYIRAVRYIHEMLTESGDTDVAAQILEHMKDALYYEYTFKFCYNSPVKTPPLSEVGWSSCGGSLTSVTNPHIHPMSSSVMDEMFYYLKNAEDSYIRSRLRDTVLWSCQCHNTFDGEFGYGKVGWMSERFCNCEGLLDETYPDGSPASTWFALMPWACGSILEGLNGIAWDDETVV